MEASTDEWGKIQADIFATHNLLVSGTNDRINPGENWKAKSSVLYLHKQCEDGEESEGGFTGANECFMRKSEGLKFVNSIMIASRPMMLSYYKLMFVA